MEAGAEMRPTAGQQRATATRPIPVSPTLVSVSPGPLTLLLDPLFTVKSMSRSDSGTIISVGKESPGQCWLLQLLETPIGHPDSFCLPMPPFSTMVASFYPVAKFMTKESSKRQLTSQGETPWQIQECKTNLRMTTKAAWTPVKKITSVKNLILIWVAISGSMFKDKQQGRAS